MINKLIFFLCIIFPVRLLPAQVTGDIVVNEIMYAPTSGMSKEWFEIYNKSSSAVNLNNWKWKDATATLRIITLQNITLNPNSYAIICEDSNAVKSFYSSFTGIILQPTNGWSALNNTGDQLVLFSSAGLVMDSINFSSSWGGSSGNKSLERILASGPSNQNTNWGTCIASNGATPNLLNSITPKQYDLELASLTFNQTSPLIGDTLGLIAKIKNRGILQAAQFSVSFYNDYNLDSIPQQNELITSVNSTSPLNPGDSVNINANTILDSSGYRQFIAKVFYTPDEDTTNNKKISSIQIGGGSTAGNIIINEIMYDYPANECEWVEFYNNSDSIVNLKNWKIQDNTSSQIIITSSDFFLMPDSFAVISKSNAIFNNHPSLSQNLVIINSSLPSLNNDGDAVIIYKVNGVISDRVDYLPSWGGQDASLERISATGLSNDSANWATSIDCEKSTPGRVNSITTAVHYQLKDLVVNEIMSSPFSGEAEWIELYNPTSQTINITNWMMYETGGNYKITDTCLALVKPGDYVVFASDTTLYNRFSYLHTQDSTQKVFILNSSLGLNNDADLVKITDLFKTTIDSVYYFDDWNNPNFPSTTGISLEKINPILNSNTASSWSSCVYPIGGTPGLRNSIYTQTLPSTATVTISPNPFSPDGDGYEDFTIINYNLPSAISQLRIKIFDVKGRLVRTLVNNQPTGSSGSVVFDGLDDEKQKLRLGIYIVFMEALDENNGVVETVKTTVVVAAKL